MAPFHMTRFYDQAPEPWYNSILRVPLVYAIHIVSQSVQKWGFVDIALYALEERTMSRSESYSVLTTTTIRHFPTPPPIFKAV